MQVNLGAYYKKKSRKKRTATVVSLHSGLSEKNLSFEQLLSAQNEQMLQLEMRLLLHDLAGRVSSQQMDMVRLRIYGCGIREIARIQKIRMKEVKAGLRTVHYALQKLCYE